jgi:hypothetical protein
VDGAGELAIVFRGRARARLGPRPRDRAAGDARVVAGRGGAGGGARGEGGREILLVRW